MKLSLLQTVAQSDQLGVLATLADAGNPSGQIAKCCDLGPNLIQFDSGCGVVGKAVPRRFVQIVFVLFGVHEPPLQLRKPPSTLCWRERIKVVKQPLQLLPGGE